MTSQHPPLPVYRPGAAYDARACAAWPLLVAASPHLARSLTPGCLQGVLGLPFHSVTAPPIHADLTALYLPAFRDLGVAAALLSPRDGTVLAALGSRSSATTMDGAVHIPFYRFGGTPPAADDDGEAAADPAVVPVGQEAKRDLERIVEECGLLRQITKTELQWEDGQGLHTSQENVARPGFAVVAHLERGARLTRRVLLRAAVRRAIVFALAWPDRFVTADPGDSAGRLAAAEFLDTAAGRQRDPVSLRWRRAGEELASGNVDGAIESMYAATLIALELPAPLLRALERPIHGRRSHLSHLERRELIYLARAGVQDLRVLAARRLGSERELPDAQSTLRQLALGPDALVRAAAVRALTQESG